MSLNSALFPNACMPFRVGKVILPERTETNIERGGGASDMLGSQIGHFRQT